MIGAKHSFQLVMNLPYRETDYFVFEEPCVILARTFLSQLL